MLLQRVPGVMGWSKDKLVVITEFETKVIDDVNF